MYTEVIACAHGPYENFTSGVFSSLTRMKMMSGLAPANASIHAILPALLFLPSYRILPHPTASLSNRWTGGSTPWSSRRLHVFASNTGLGIWIARPITRSGISFYPSSTHHDTNSACCSSAASTSTPTATV